MKRILALALTLLLASPANAAVTIIQENVTVPGSGTAFDFATDSTNNWPLVQLFDGTNPLGTTAHPLAIGGPVTVVSGGIASGAVASGAIASGAYASGSIGSGAVASGAIAAGAVAAGAYVSGSVLSGAYADGAITTLGTEADAAWTTGSGTQISVLKAIDRDILGNADPCNSAVRVINGPIAFSSATTTKIASGNTGQNLYLCELIGVPNGANNITLVAGTKVTTDCDTSPTTVGGPWYLGNIGNGLDLGKGITSFAITNATGKDLCITTSTTAAIAITAITVLK